MKQAVLKTTLLSLIAALFLLNASPVQACDRSEIALDSVVIGGGFLDIYIQMNIGGGITGSSKGAGGDSHTFAFAYYGSPTLAPITYTASVTSDSTGAVYPSFNAGTAFGSRFTIGYISSGTPFACISTTASCGGRHTDIKQIHFRVNELPDSVRLLGIEGGGNPFAGCYPDGDMLIDFTTLPVVWASFEAEAKDNGVALEWSTSSETNNDKFLIQRSTDGLNFENIGEVAAVGNSSKLEKYSYSDAHPMPGTNFYKVVQVDFDGKSSESEVLQVQFEVEPGVKWTQVGPNPVQDMMNVGFSTETSQNFTLQVIDIQGRVLQSRTIEAFAGQNNLDLDMGQFAAGFYYVQLSSPTVKLDKKILKL